MPQVRFELDARTLSALRPIVVPVLASHDDAPTVPELPPSTAPARPDASFEVDPALLLASGIHRRSRGRALLWIAVAWLATTAACSLIVAHLLFGARLAIFTPRPPYVVKIIQGSSASLQGPCPLPGWQPPLVAVDDLPRVGPPAAAKAPPVPRRPPRATAPTLVKRARVEPPSPRAPSNGRVAASPHTLEDYMRGAVEADTSGHADTAKTHGGQ